MERLYTEGVAIHGDPESCVVAREGPRRSVDRGNVQAGLLSRVITEFGTPTLSTEAEGQYRQWRYRESLVGPVRSETPCMYGTSMRENREIPGSPARVITGRADQGRPRPHA